MIRINSLKLNIGYTSADIKKAILKRLLIDESELISYKPVKISLDARKKDSIKYILCADAVVRNERKLLSNKRISDIAHTEEIKYRDPAYDQTCGTPSGVASSQKAAGLSGMAIATGREGGPAAKAATPDREDRPVIIGAGPAGLFCALKLAEAGLRPIVIERGAPVEERIRDVAGFWSGGPLNTESNVQFGEGGAGTFSDGKLNTMVHDSFGRMQEVFRIFIEHGADPAIAYTNKPHIGTDRLTAIVSSIRRRIIALGGEVRFHTKLTDIKTAGDHIKSAMLSNGEELSCQALVLAIGHSARDTFEMLSTRCIAMEQKAFAVGMRVQHPQELINRDRYGAFCDRLPAADYKLTYNTAEGRGVYSFCMCPGGFVVNASSEEGMLAVNGMSNSDRSEPTANSAVVVTVNPDDFGSDSVLAGLAFQRRMERAAFAACGGLIPVQYYGDFLKGRVTSSFTDNMPNTKGGYAGGDINSFLPAFITSSVKEAFPAFDRTIRGYADEHALLLGLESRTSSPVRIVRGEDLESLSLKGLYPCGEGAGYAGGITSAAMDGLKVYEAIITKQRTK